MKRVSHMAPMRALNRPKPTVSVERRPDGALVLSASHPDGSSVFLAEGSR
jgi:hypothetical protein